MKNATSYARLLTWKPNMVVGIDSILEHNGQLYVARDGFVTPLVFNQDHLTTVVGGSVSTPLFATNLSQSGTNAPVLSNVRNNTGGTYEIAYFMAGRYNLTFSEGIFENPYLLFLNNPLTAPDQLLSYIQTTDFTVVLVSTRISEGYVNDIFNKASLLILSL